MAIFQFDFALGQFWRDLRLSMDIAVELFHRGVMSAETCGFILHKYIMGSSVLIRTSRGQH